MVCELSERGMRSTLSRRGMRSALSMCVGNRCDRSLYIGTGSSSSKIRSAPPCGDVDKEDSPHGAEERPCHVCCGC